jgi:hypothetical protein
MSLGGRNDPGNMAFLILVLNLDSLLNINIKKTEIVNQLVYLIDYAFIKQFFQIFLLCSLVIFYQYLFRQFLFLFPCH